MSEQVIRLMVDLREERTVKALRDEVAALQAENLTLRERCRRSEFSLMCEYSVNQQLTDWLDNNGIKFPRRLLRPNPIDTETTGS